MKFEKRYKTHHDVMNSFASYSNKKILSFNDLLANLENEPLNEAIEHCFYIHVPYCDKICSFCNLNRHLKDEQINTYHLKVIKQIEEYAQCNQLRKLKIGSIYFGGVTPTILAAEQLIAIINKLKENFNIQSDCEISCETTLHNLDLKKLKAMNQAGFNRLSIGIQTFDDEGRKFFNRTFSKDEVIAQLKQIKQNFNGIITVDKIYNYHLETLDKLEEDIRIIKELDLDSVSFYSLMIHQGSSLSKNINYQKVKEENDLLFHNTFVKHFLDTGDYELLELTKIAKKNRDNYKYINIRNKQGYTIPLGQGAGGNIGNYQIMNVDFNRIMIAQELNPQMKKADYLYGKMQFSEFDFNDNFLLETEKKKILLILKQFISEGYLDNNDEIYSYTKKGLYYGNNISSIVIQNFLFE